jgi:Tol biopolymer transport system component
VANVFTSEARQVTDNAVDDRNPAWSQDGQLITYQEQLSSRHPSSR